MLYSGCKADGSFRVGWRWFCMRSTVCEKVSSMAPNNNSSDLPFKKKAARSLQILSLK